MPGPGSKRMNRGRRCDAAATSRRDFSGKRQPRDYSWSLVMLLSVELNRPKRLMRALISQLRFSVMKKPGGGVEGSVFGGRGTGRI